MNDPEDLTPEEIEAAALKITEDNTAKEESGPLQAWQRDSLKLEGRPLEEFLKRGAPLPNLDADRLREKIAKAQLDMGNQTVIELAKNGGDGDSTVGGICRDIWKSADQFEQARASQLGLSCEEYRETINKVVKEAYSKKVVLGSEREDGSDGITYRKRFHIQRLKSLVALHMGISEDQLSDNDIEQISSQLTPCPQHVPLTPNDGVTEVEIGFQYLIEQMDKQLADEASPEPTVVGQVVETAVEVKTELDGVLEALQNKAKSALDELASNAKRNLGSLLRKSAEYALYRVEKKERHLSDDYQELLNDTSDAKNRLNKILKKSKIARAAEEEYKSGISIDEEE